MRGTPATYADDSTRTTAAGGARAHLSSFQAGDERPKTECREPRTEAIPNRESRKPNCLPTSTPVVPKLCSGKGSRAGKRWGSGFGFRICLGFRLSGFGLLSHGTLAPRNQVTCAQGAPTTKHTRRPTLSAPGTGAEQSPESEQGRPERNSNSSPLIRVHSGPFVVPDWISAARISGCRICLSFTWDCGLHSPSVFPHGPRRPLETCR